MMMMMMMMMMMTVVVVVMIMHIHRRYFRKDYHLQPNDNAVYYSYCTFSFPSPPPCLSNLPGEP